MKRVLVFVLALALVVSITGVCFAAAGKVAIVTNTVSQNEEEYRSAQEMIAKYGADKIIHVTWPDNFMTEQEQMVSVVAKLAADPDVKALIINQAVPGTNAAVDKLLETRKDIFIVYCSPQENPPDVAKRASAILIPNELQQGYEIPIQAKALGAKVFVHYSFPRHMSIPFLAGRREIMREKCKELGMEFVDATAPDPTGDAGVPGAQQFILEDIPKMVARYGKDTSFFATNCSMQIPIIKKVVDEKAIYPQPCCASPYHGFPTALGITSNTDNPDNLQHVINETRKVLAEKGVAGRLSTYPVPMAMMFTIGSTEYAMRIIGGDTHLRILDVDVLNQCLSNYAKTPADTKIYVDDNGVSYPNFVLALQGYLTY